MTNILALYTHNFDLLEKSEGYENTDNLTLLYNHRGFQEILSNEISRAETNKQSVSVVMMDICNILFGLLLAGQQLIQALRFLNPLLLAFLD